MSELELSLPNRKFRGEKRQTELAKFSVQLQKLSEAVGFKMSARGWCYFLEGYNLVDKGQFDMIEDIINTCRREGFIPIDFTAEEEGRQFSGVEEPEEDSPREYLRKYIRAVLECGNWYTPDWWEDEEYYIQMVVEKIDLKTLFEPICENYHIPIATAKGWSSMLMRATYARRYQEAEEDGLECVLLYCGDHDADGLRISDFLRSNLDDLKYIEWEDGTDGYDPENLIIERFGLDFDFIEEHNLSWVENLITGSGKNLASPRHPNHYMDYVQDYIQKYGVRKCEANALMRNPESGRKLCQEAIEKYLGHDAIHRFRSKRNAILSEMAGLRDETGLQETIEKALREFDEAEDENEEEE